jgi:hypothetical protein
MRSFYVVCFLLLALFVKAQERPLLKKSNKTFDLKRDRSLQNNIVFLEPFQKRPLQKQDPLLITLLFLKNETLLL